MPNYLKLAAESALSVFGVRGQYEGPPYDVIDRIGAAEIRAYAPRLVAETTVPAMGMRAGRDEAFGRLARYIFGANRGKAELAMTAPVSTTMAGREIAMTSPVATAEEGGAVTMRFFLPRALTLGTAPAPLDGKVRIAELPAETLAVLTFSGVLSDARFAAKARELEAALEGSAWRAIGPAVAFGYDPPFTIPFLRKNEAAAPVEKR